MNAIQDAVIFLLNVVIEHNPTSAHANDAMRKVENIFAEEDENEKKLVDAINARMRTIDQRITEQAEKASSFGAHLDEKDPSFGGQDAPPAGVHEPSTIHLGDTIELPPPIAPWERSK